MTDMMSLIEGTKKNNVNRQEPLVDNIAHVNMNLSVSQKYATS